MSDLNLALSLISKLLQALLNLAATTAPWGSSMMGGRECEGGECGAYI